jgi:hypothetical protein
MLCDICKYDIEDKKIKSHAKKHERMFKVPVHANQTIHFPPGFKVEYFDETIDATNFMKMLKDNGIEHVSKKMGIKSRFEGFTRKVTTVVYNEHWYEPII